VILKVKDWESIAFILVFWIKRRRRAEEGMMRVCWLRDMASGGVQLRGVVEQKRTQ